MSSPSPDLDALIALNQEIAAMVRAGIPLEFGLKAASSSRSARFSALAARMSERLSLGDSLIEALRKEGSVVSPAYAAVVEAGLAAGRLPEALEELANLGLAMQEIRRHVWLAVTYPAIVCSLAYALFVAFISFGVPIWLQTRDSLFLPPNWFFGLLATLNQTVRWWGPTIPTFVAVIACGPLLLSLAGLWPLHDGVWRFPGVRFVYQYLRRAQFARLLALLIEHEIPAPRAVMLAAESTGDDRLSRSAATISDRLVHGSLWEDAVASASGLPSFLRWMMIAGEREGALAVALRQTAESYQRRAERGLEWLRTTLPVVLVVLICGLVVTTYGLGLFLPMQQFWLDLTRANP
jgi:general secretion pathway protein F